MDGIDLLLWAAIWAVWYCGIRPQPARHPGPRIGIGRLMRGLLAGYSLEEVEADVPHDDDSWEDDDRYEEEGDDE